MSENTLQNIADSPIPQPSQLQQHHHHHHQYPSAMEQPYNQGSIPSIHHQISSTSFLPSGKQESDPRLPGMMPLSQPSTPRPSHQNSPTKDHQFHSTPYSALNRKRNGRNETFSTESGPFFSSTKPMDNLYALDRSTLLNVRIQAKMDKGFFLADNDWTCYRRNYFQVSAAFSVQGLHQYYPEHETPCLVECDGVLYPVNHFSINIAARVSNSDKKIELIQHTPKRDKGPQTVPSPKLIVPGGNLTMNSVGINQTVVTFERIQFKTATANNGKRRAAQQYYVCLVDIYAEVDGGARRVKVASCQSAPLVVRGRSPGHYSDSHNHHHHQHLENTMPLPQLGQQHVQNEDSAQNSRFIAPSFPRPPMTPPSGVIGPDYASPYSHSYSAYPPPPTNYSHFNPMMMPPTPTNGSSNNSSYMLPGMTTEGSDKHTNIPEDWNRSRNEHNSTYFSQQQTTDPYGRKYSNGATIQ